jgi:hypothetical protein
MHELCLLRFTHGAAFQKISTYETELIQYNTVYHNAVSCETKNRAKVSVQGTTGNNSKDVP